MLEGLTQGGPWWAWLAAYLWKAWGSVTCTCGDRRTAPCCEGPVPLPVVACSRLPRLALDPLLPAAPADGSVCVDHLQMGLPGGALLLGPLSVAEGRCWCSWGRSPGCTGQALSLAMGQFGSFQRFTGELWERLCASPG